MCMLILTKRSGQYSTWGSIFFLFIFPPISFSFLFSPTSLLFLILIISTKCKATNTILHINLPKSVSNFYCALLFLFPPILVIWTKCIVNFHLYLILFIQSSKYFAEVIFNNIKLPFWLLKMNGMFWVC